VARAESEQVQSAPDEHENLPHDGDHQPSVDRGPDPGDVAGAQLGTQQPVVDGELDAKSQDENGEPEP